MHTHTATMAPYAAKVDTPRDVEDDDFDFEYFSRTYKPLSNLPTPPPSSRNSASPSPALGLDNDEFTDSRLLGTFSATGGRVFCIYRWSRMTNQDRLQDQQYISSTFTHHQHPSPRRPSPMSKQSSLAPPSLSKRLRWLCASSTRSTPNSPANGAWTCP